MDFDLSANQQRLQALTRAFAEANIAPVAARYDQEEIYPHDILEALGPTGLMTPTLPPELGGSGADFIGEALVFEEIGKICSSVRTILSVHNSLCALTIRQWGSEAQKERYLSDLGHGRLLGCFALTEFTAGSEATNQNLTAQQTADGWLLNGHKAWVSSGGQAGLCLLFAQTDPELGHRGIAAFLVPAGTPGFTTEKVTGKTGLRAAHTAHLALDEVLLSDDQLVGQVGEGFKIAMSALDNGRYGVAAGCVGQAQACLDASIAYARERTAFGKPIASKQLVQEMIAGMAVAVESARYLVYRAGHKKNQGKRNTYETSVAKLVATETAVQVARDAIQLHGAVGYTNSYPVERHLRDALATTIYEGTSQIQKLIIGRHLTGENAFV
ncbi:MAG: acyl-CoA dehydrogenase family protein [Chloroflexota bacterium]|nr:MAG: acyl-CoA dehydrogenase family protein [Chloroflexota bacterium]